MLLIGVRFSLGFWKSSDNRAAAAGGRESLILSEEAFGHPGSGGSIGFADPAANMSFGYSMNKMGQGKRSQRKKQAQAEQKPADEQGKS